MTLDAFKNLFAYAGTWRGDNTLQDPHTGQPQQSASWMTLTPVLRDKFMRIDYVWSYQGAPQEGSLLVGYQPEANAITAHWIDTWHMNRGVMACQGTGETDGEITVQGFYAAPPGPDWGWRIVISPSAGDAVRITMFNVAPDGEAALAVESDYVRA